MFTGIIEELGKIQSITQEKITIQAKIVLNGTNIGDSISVNGVCLTVTNIGSDYFSADISPETMRATALSNLKISSLVNLERAVQVGSRLGGHIVTGHVDDKGKCISIKKDGDFYYLKIQISHENEKYAAKKGSITVNGISLTIAEIIENFITIAVIPHTFENTNLKTLQTGDFVNIETDILAKYVEKILSSSDNRTGISMEFLVENGF